LELEIIARRVWVWVVVVKNLCMFLGSVVNEDGTKKEEIRKMFHLRFLGSELRTCRSEM
jgi:hypothetical protein